ncbi:MAG: condensation domain-containing protein [Chthoniobacteraceae bacterium]
MSADKRARLKQWLESGEASLHPLTFPQRELWENPAVPPADVANHICCLIHVEGSITPDDCRAAIQKVVERQEALRLSILPGKERPLQMVRKSGEASFRARDLSPAQARPEAIEELVGEVFRTPFDLVQGPLYRVEMLRRSADDLVLAFAIHHAVADGWTLGVFVRELVGAYLHGKMGSTEPLPPVPLSYTAWGAAERAFWQPAELEPRAAFWKKTLAGNRRLWSPPGGSTELRRWVSQIPAELSKSIRDLTRRSGATLFTTLLAGFQVTLAQWTEVDDIVVGTPVANRGKPAVRETMGYCSGVVPLRGQVDRERAFLGNVRAVHQTTIDAFANAMPFAELVAAVGESPPPGHHPIFDVRFALQNHPIPDVAMPGLSAKLRMRSTGTARFHLGCEITEQGDTLEVVWLYRPGLFSPAEVEDLDRLLHRVLTNACRAPETRIAALTAVRA